MCGIAGIVTKDARRHERVLEGMTSSLKHRGPDGQRVHFFPSCGLGHRRLSIVDLAGGWQPMFTPDKQKAVIFNGEIFGYREIRESLRDYPFATSSDTEAILALYEKHGEEFVGLLPGQFAFALWDQTREKLVCARDRYGEKPFYYAFGRGGEFIFASEIKAILESGLVEPVLDQASVAHYLKYLYIHPASTIYRNIFALPPAHMLELENGQLRIRRYWHMPEIDESIELDDAVPVFRHLLEEAVRKQLIADVPVGAFLSGGLDSSTIVALASTFSPHIRTFSFDFPGVQSETAYARQIARKYETDHMELSDNEDLAALLIKMQEVYDEPFGDSSNIPTYLISKLCRQHATVVLSGDGGDEFLGGYGWYKPFLHFDKSSKLTSSLLRASLLGTAAKALARVSGSLPIHSGLYRRHRGLSLAKHYRDVFEAHLEQNVVFGDQDLRQLGCQAKPVRHAPSWQLAGTLDDAIRLDVENYMPGDILVKVDRASMAHGLELRAPFLDVAFSDFCLRMPYRLKVTRETDKRILRAAFSHLWTDAIRRRTKQGFGAPVHQWLTRASLKALAHEYLDDPHKKIFQLLSFRTTRPFVQKPTYKKWSLLVLSLWLETHRYG